MTYSRNGNGSAAPDVLTNVDLPIADHYDLSIRLKLPC
jgi:hypothetical protein